MSSSITVASWTAKFLIHDVSMVELISAIALQLSFTGAAIK